MACTRRVLVLWLCAGTIAGIGGFPVSPAAAQTPPYYCHFFQYSKLYGCNGPQAYDARSQPGSGDSYYGSNSAYPNTVAPSATAPAPALATPSAATAHPAMTPPPTATSHPAMTPPMNPIPGLGPTPVLPDVRH